MLSSLKRFSKDEVAPERLKILEFYGTYGEKACLEAFGVDRKLLYVWRKKFNLSQRKLSSLIPNSTRPTKIRTSNIDLKILGYIRYLRETHFQLSKQKMKPLVDEFCLKEGLPFVSESTIGRIIKRNNFYFQKTGRIFHHPSKARELASKRQTKNKRNQRLRMKYAPCPTGFGHLQMDTLVKLTDGIKLYVYSAIDIKGKFAVSLPYPALNSQYTLDFFKKVELVCPYQIKSVQTDNGLEFQGTFEEYLKQRKTPHFFIYPRCPRINGVVERYQRSLQEEFLNDNLHLIHYPKLFSSKLADYLIFFFTQRIHQGLGLKTPMDYLISQGAMSKMSWTSTHF